MLRRVFILLATFFFGTAVAASDNAILKGIVTKVRDGDTIEVGKIPIRLNGVSAPELGEPLGEKSKEYMSNMVLGETLECSLNGKKTYDRLVGICHLNGQDIAAALVSAGLALDCPHYSDGRYDLVQVPEALKRIKLPAYCSK